jgi:hypothetical protein
MMVKEKAYVGELIRKYIKDNKLTNGYVIKGLIDAGIPITDTRFSNKIYGEREQFSAQEIALINKILKTDFKLTV